MERNEIIIKALFCLKSHKESNFRNAIKNGKFDISNKRFNEICEIDAILKDLIDGEKTDLSTFTNRC